MRELTINLTVELKIQIDDDTLPLEEVEKGVVDNLDYKFEDTEISLEYGRIVDTSITDYEGVRDHL